MSANKEDRFAAPDSALVHGCFSGRDGHSKHPRLFAIKVKLVHAKNSWGKLANIFNPNHRHDEAQEQAVDRRRAEAADAHRYRSFAPETDGNDVKWYVDGRDYFWAVSVALERASECIYIADWWLSPELFLRRPPANSKEWRLDRVLRRKAELGVKIYVAVYKEITYSLTCNSAHTKKALESLCPRGSRGHGNIVVVRHPDHDPFLHGADPTFFWAHHEKFVVVDHKIAFVGGLDLCFGRWDMRQHPLTDTHPEHVAAQVWPGQDFNNNRIMDFQSVQDWKANQLDKTEYGRMPWHDVGLGIAGPAVMSIAEHFVGRWNFVKRDKYKRNTRRPWLQLRGVSDELVGVQRPAFPLGGYIKHPLHADTEALLANRGPCRVQLVRSSADWSHGIQPKDGSIQTAYRNVIAAAQRFVYIENQFFITATGDAQKPVHNQIGAALVDAIARAHDEGRKFRVVVVIPAIPGFPGDLREDAALGTRAIIDYQYQSINRGEHSIYGQLAARGIDAAEYLFVFNLRTYDRLHTTASLREREERTGVPYSAALGDYAEAVGGGKRRPDILAHSPAMLAGRSSWPSLSAAVPSRGAVEVGHGSAPAKDTVAADAMRGGSAANIADEHWDDDEEHEKMGFVQEELYVHAKVLIADDEVMVVGSSNINDRSQQGDHDSELSAVVEHAPTVAALRQQLWREHLGLLPPQPLDAADDPNAQPPGDGPNRVSPDPIVEDALSDELWALWTRQATVNTQVYHDLFHVDPDNCIKTWKDYDSFCPLRADVPTGHIWDPHKYSARQVKDELAKVRGHLVWMPLDFLRDEHMAAAGLAFNPATKSIYT